MNAKSFCIPIIRFVVHDHAHEHLHHWPILLFRWMFRCSAHPSAGRRPPAARMPSVHCPPTVRPPGSHGPRMGPMGYSFSHGPHELHGPWAPHGLNSAPWAPQGPWNKKNGGTIIKAIRVYNIWLLRIVIPIVSSRLQNMEEYGTLATKHVTETYHCQHMLRTWGQCESSVMLCVSTLLHHVMWYCGSGSPLLFLLTRVFSCFWDIYEDDALV